MREKPFGGRGAAMFLVDQAFRGAEMFMPQHLLDGHRRRFFSQGLLAGGVPQGEGRNARPFDPGAA